MTWYTSAGPPATPVLIVPGLNLSRGRLLPLVQALRHAGAAPVVYTLPGHDGNREALRRITAASLRASFDRALTRFLIVSGGAGGGAGGASRGADAAATGGFGLPSRGSSPILIGVSLGALLFLDALARGVHTAIGVPATVAIDRAILISPAIALRRRTALVRALARVLPDRVPIPSVSPRRSRVYATLPPAAYRALFTILREWRAATEARANAEARSTAIARVRCSIFIDPEDELVSYTGLHRLVRDGIFADATICVPPKPFQPRRRGPAHLMIDPATMGDSLWELLLATVSGGEYDQISGWTHTSIQNLYSSRSN